MTLKRSTIFAIAAGLVLLVGAVVILITQLTREPVPEFSEHPAGPERKDVFFSYFLPMVEQRNEQIRQTRVQLKAWKSNAASLSGSDKRELMRLSEKYRLDDFDPANAEHWQTLLQRVDIVPPSLALAQAANESAWGTSRFARTANNYYGQWCFKKGCGVVPKTRDTGKTHEVARFDSPRESVEAYMQNLNSHPAYRHLRVIRHDLRASDQPITGVALAAGLDRYSERGEEYIKELRSMIRYNKLGQYDNSY